jgi:hypothetical protein
MICPACKSENEMAYSALIHGFVCLEPQCSLELEMEQCDLAALLTAPIEDPVYA